MKIAVIDMGTNTFHLMLAEVTEETQHVFHKERVAVRIGEKGINKDKITDEAWERAISTVVAFKEKIAQSKISKIFATGTSAIRNASNGINLVKEIERKTGISIQIISGEREAELILVGARKALDLGDEKHLIMDIGGGSIEFIIADNTKTYWLRSFEVGGQRLIEKFHHADPIGKSELSDLEAYFRSELAELVEQCSIHNPRILVGCSGTFDTLSDIYCASENYAIEENQTELPLPISSFHHIYQELITKTRTERLAIPGMIEMRVDMIVVATTLINYLIKKLSITNLRISAYALKEGVLFNTIDTVRNSETPN
ncbi:MAG: exopolyphosphatase [Cyclobacteriaceae bacterium]